MFLRVGTGSRMIRNLVIVSRSSKRINSETINYSIAYEVTDDSTLGCCGEKMVIFAIYTCARYSDKI